MKSRLVYLDVIRLLACVMVVLMHSPMPEAGGSSMFLVSLSYLTAPCIGLFFMVSGALLLPVQSTQNKFLGRRLSKVLWPTILWTLIYLGAIVAEGNCKDPLHDILSIPFSVQGSGVMWFMYVLIGLYMLAPVISPWLEKATEKEIRLYLLLWLLTGCFPVISMFLQVDSGPASTFYYFTGYAGYFLAGYYLNRFHNRLTLKLLLPLSVIALIAPTACYLTGIEVDFYSVFWYLGIFVIALTLTIFRILQLLEPRLTHISQHTVSMIANLSALTFGIYLSHILIMRNLLWHLDWIRGVHPYPLQTFVIAALTFILATLLSWIVSLTPIGKYIIGYQKTIKIS